MKILFAAALALICSSCALATEQAGFMRGFEPKQSQKTSEVKKMPYADTKVGCDCSKGACQCNPERGCGCVQNKPSNGVVLIEIGRGRILHLRIGRLR